MSDSQIIFLCAPPLEEIMEIPNFPFFLVKNRRKQVRNYVGNGTLKGTPALQNVKPLRMFSYFRDDLESI